MVLWSCAYESAIAAHAFVLETNTTGSGSQAVSETKNRTELLHVHMKLSQGCYRDVGLGSPSTSPIGQSQHKLRASRMPLKPFPQWRKIGKSGVYLAGFKDLITQASHDYQEVTSPSFPITAALRILFRNGR